MRRCRISRSPPSFFTLTPEYRKQLFKNIFNLVYYGKGFTHNEVYHMPIWMRRNYLNLIIEERKEQKKVDEQHMNDSKQFSKSQQKMARPDIKSPNNIVVKPKFNKR